MTTPATPIDITKWPSDMKRPGYRDTTTTPFASSSRSVTGQGVANLPVGWLIPGPGVALQVLRLRVVNLTGQNRQYSLRYISHADEVTLQNTAGAAYVGNQLVSLTSVPAGKLLTSAIRASGAVAELGTQLDQYRLDNLPADASGDPSTLTIDFPEPGIWLFGTDDPGPSGLALFDTSANSGFRMSAYGFEWQLTRKDGKFVLPPNAPISVQL